MTFHPGEQAVQLRAGWRRDRWGSAGVAAEIPPSAAEFLGQQRMLFLGGTDRAGAVWATILTGPTGFLRAADERTIHISSLPVADDPLADHLADNDVGALVIDPQTRRRMRINGRARSRPGGLVLDPDQVYSNCPKYVRARSLVQDPDPTAPNRARAGDRLTPAQQRWIGTADTFFVATHAPGLGADVSHRGGNSGFVDVAGPGRLVWPDYVGNSMYMTLGNLELASGCGLLFLDWNHGHTLQLTGRATTDWSPDRVAAVPGARRLIDFTVERVVQIDNASPLRWLPGEPFERNPPTGSSRG